MALLGAVVLTLSIAVPGAGAPRGTDPASGGVSSGTEAQSPADVVRSALRAQVAGDIDALMEHFALDRMDEAAIADGRLAFGTFGERVGLSKLKVKPLATGYGDLGDLAVVRAEVSVRMTADGETYRQTNGIIATLVGGEGSWRILALDPDDLLNAEIVAREAPKAMAMVTTGRATAAATPKRAVTLHQINALLDKAMSERRMSEAEMLKLTVDGQAAFIGRFPGVGDAIAQVYQVANVGYNLYQGGRELVTRGFTPILLMQVAQTAVGAVQIATELVPGADTAADAVGMYVENVANHMEMQRAIREFQAEATRPRDGYDAHFHAVPGYLYPDGLRMSLDPEVETAYGRPIQGVALTTMEDLGRAIPFQIVADLPLPSELEPFAEELGAVQVGDGGEWRVPVDLSLLATGTESTEYAAGDRVLQDPRIIRSADGATTAIAWTSTCVRGSQQLALVLPSGEPVLGPEVINKVMNEITGLRVPETDPAGIIQVPLSEPKTIRVMGTPSVPGRSEVDLTRYRECLFTSLHDNEVITIERDEGDQLRIVGVAPGTASLRLRLDGATGRLSDRVPDIVKEVPVVVTDDIGGRWQGEHAATFYNDDWTVDYQATVTTTGSLDGCIEERAGPWLVLTCPVPPATTDPPEVDRYTVTVTVRDVAPISGWEPLLEAMGKGWSKRVLIGFSEADLVETGTIRTTLEVPRKPGQSDVGAEVVVWLDYLPDDSLSRWTASGSLFKLRLVGQ
jgi:hypothetical protein